jgi:enoyl-CoA hydratase/carnithine racemase
VPIEQVVTVPLPDAGPAALWEVLTAAGRDLTGATRVVVVRGQGDDFFEGAAVAGSPEEPPTAALEWLGRPDLITIAAISGRATGAGLDVALACDLRVAAHDAELTASGSIAGTAWLGELMGRSQALAFVVKGEAISGSQAAARGLANLSVESGTLDASIEAIVASVLRTPREAATVAKAVLRESDGDRRRLVDHLAAGIRLAANEP